MADTPAPAQGGGTPAAVAAPAPAAAVVVSRQETDAFTLRLIGRYGSTENALTHLAGEQLRYRKRAQVAEKTAADLQTKVPTAGAVVLTGDDAKAFNDLRAADTKFTLATLGQSLKELSELKSKSSQESRDATLATAAGKDYKVKVLKRLVGDLPIEFKTVLQKKEDGEDGMEEVKVPYVKVGDTLELMSSWLEREHKDFMDVIKVQESDGNGTTQEDKAAPSSGATMPKQTAAGSQTVPKKNADVMKAVDKGLAGAMSPSQRRKEAAGGA